MVVSGAGEVRRREMAWGWCARGREAGRGGGSGGGWEEGEVELDRECWGGLGPVCGRWCGGVEAVVQHKTRLQ